MTLGGALAATLPGKREDQDEEARLMEDTLETTSAAGL